MTEDEFEILCQCAAQAAVLCQCAEIVRRRIAWEMIVQAANEDYQWKGNG